MFGLINLPYVLTLLILLIAVVTDLRSGKIYNWLTIPFFFAGVAFSIIYSGKQGLYEVIFSVSFAAIAYGLLYLMHVLGAGDVKLFMAMGAWLSFGIMWKIALLSVLVGGVISLLFLYRKNLLRGFLQRVQSHKDLNTVPFGISIALAFLVVVLVEVHPV